MATKRPQQRKKRASRVPPGDRREDILRVHVKNVKLDENVDLKEIASITPGFVGADLSNLVNEAALLAAQEGHAEEAKRLKKIEADFLDSKQRLERRFAIQAEAQRKDVLRDLLPVLDNLDLALDHLPPGDGGQDLRQGVELTRQSFLKILVYESNTSCHVG